MQIQCEAERYFSSLEKLIKKLSDKTTLQDDDDRKLRNLLDNYWNVECPFDCVPNRCSYADPKTWIEYHGYTCMADLLLHFEYEELGVLELKDKKSIDALAAHWGRRPGHYNP